ncbi:LacI family DNA-binding transcriptional regulator [Actinokineospora soli]|uniref:LacI family DNA-binding transcriptional regulator n=1 Tax=Actinokineospora soli TaxID=1048753 RepID=A0ABW2TTY6_9PSEU
MTSVDPVAGAPARRGPRMRDVAALAGVGIKTVSRVVNNEPGVSPDLAARVRRAVEQLGYRPNLGASSLRRADGKTAAIALVLENIANPFSAAVHRAVEDVARERGVLVFAGSLDEDPRRERDLVQAFTMRRADGLIIAPASDDQGYLYDDVVRTQTPVVFVDRPPHGLRADAVLATNAEGAAAAVHHLADAGHERIAYLGDYVRIPTAADRFRGYREAMVDRGLRVRAEHVAHDLHSAEAAERAVRAMLALDDPPTALFSSQNLVTIAAVRALRALGRQHAVALVGFDDFPVADLLDPGVTVVAQDPAAIGRTAAELLFRRLDGERWEPRQHRVETRLIARGSGELRPAVAS